MIRFKCPHCKKPLSAKDHLAGKKAKCTTCQKPVVIPAPPAKTTTTPGAPEEPPVDVDAIAAAALQDEPTNGKTAEPAETIEFKCELCDHEITVPRSEAGKRMQCPNPECRSLIKVPAAQDGKPKALPTVAQLKQQVEKLDEAAWGTQTDRGRVTTEALKIAGAIPEVKKPPRSPREWIRLVMISIAVVAGVALLGFAATRVTVRQRGKNFILETRKYVEPAKGGDTALLVKEPVARAAIYRAMAEYKLRQGDRPNNEMLDDMKKALATLQLQPKEKPSVERELFLGELALLMTDLGGSADQEIAKEKYDWHGKTLRDELMRVLEAIRTPEARTIAMRALVTRLVKDDQAELAISLASQLSNPEPKKGRPPVTSQLAVLLLLRDQPLDKLDIKAPNMPKERLEPLARGAYAEFHARKGNLEEAKNLAFAKGTPAERLEACVGVAQVILQRKGDGAGEFADEALKITELRDPRTISPWLLLQAIRVGARVRGKDAVTDLPRKLLPPDFQPRGYLEIALAEADASPTGLGTTSLADIPPTSASLDIGWEALARQNARVGSSDISVAAENEANARFRPMVYIGGVLGGRAGPEQK
jgi:hypothetical protein